jgi:hypothetical protein
MPDYDLTSPLYLVLLVFYLILYCIKGYVIQIERVKRGLQTELSREAMLQSPPLPEWMRIFLYIDFVLLGILLILNWKLTIIIWIIKFFSNLTPIFSIIGYLFLLPFKPKPPDNVSTAHLSLSGYIKDWNEKCSKDWYGKDKDWYDKYFSDNYDKTLQKMREVGFEDKTEEALISSLVYLKADASIVEFAVDLYREEKDRFLKEREWEAREERWEKEKAEQNKEWERLDQLSSEELKDWFDSEEE